MKSLADFLGLGLGCDRDCDQGRRCDCDAQYDDRDDQLDARPGMQMLTYAMLLAVVVGAIVLGLCLPPIPPWVR